MSTTGSRTHADAVPNRTGRARMTCACLILAMTSLAVEGRSDVTTTDGKLVGFKKYVERVHVVDTFYGIPYARPPVGPLRFKPPLPATPWKGEKSAKYLPNSCLQVEDGGGADSGGGGRDGLRLQLYREELLSPPTKVSEKISFVCLFVRLFVLKYE